MTPALQHRHYDYVLGPNQDARLTSVQPGANLEEILLVTDDDAPFMLTGRAVRCAYTEANPTQSPLQGLKTKWTGPLRDFRQQGYVLESLQMAYFGQFGNPKPIVPAITYPARSVLRLDLKHTGTIAITNLTFFFRGFKLFPKGTVPAYTYPARPAKMASQTFSYPVFVSQLGVSEIRPNQTFTVKGDADFVLRGGQGFIPSLPAADGSTLAEVFIRLKDFNKQPYSSDYMPFDVLFGCGQFPAVIPVGPPALTTIINPFGTGPSHPGLFYPELYLPAQHQLIYDLQRSDGVGGGSGNMAQDFQFNFIGGKVFTK